MQAAQGRASMPRSGSMGGFGASDTIDGVADDGKPLVCVGIDDDPILQIMHRALFESVLSADMRHSLVGGS
eukprot:2821570-Prymnesium_polylepis.1